VIWPSARSAWFVSLSHRKYTTFYTIEKAHSNIKKQNSNQFISLTTKHFLKVLCAMTILEHSKVKNLKEVEASKMIDGRLFSSGSLN